MDESGLEGTAGDDAAPGGAHPLERYFAVPPGGWPEQQPAAASVPPAPNASSVPPAPGVPSVPAEPRASSGANGGSRPPPPDQALPGPQQTATPHPAEQAVRRPYRRVRLAVISLALVLVAGGAIGGIVSTGSGPPAPGTGVTPATFVVSSTQTTLSQHTADIDHQRDASLPTGKSIPMQGTGTANFDTNSFAADISLASGATSLVEHELVVADHVYIGLTVDGTSVSAITGGPEWVNVPLPDQDSSSLGAGNIDPLDQLKLLEQKGATVVPLGTSTVDGTTVSGYAVTFSAAEMQQREQQEVQSLGLTPTEAQQALQRGAGTGTTEAERVLRQQRPAAPGIGVIRRPCEPDRRNGADELLQFRDTGDH